jgi:hypothetical protein
VFKRFFGKKNDGFFLQLSDEDAASKPVAKVKDSVAPVDPVTTTVTPTVTAPVTSTQNDIPAASSNKADKKVDKKSAKKAEETKTPIPVAVAAPVVPAITNFATDYLIKPSSSSGRRLPGANMKGFLAMARNVEKPKAFKATAEERKASMEKAPAVVEKKAPINPKEAQKLVTGEPEMRY